MSHFAAASQLIACAGASLTTLALSLKRDRRLRLATVVPDRGCDLIELQSRHGYNEHSFVGLSVQPEAWADPICDAAVTYSESGKFWIVAGEPLAAENDLAAVTRRFVEHARNNGRIAVFLPATERFARSVAGEGLRTVKVGAAPYFDLKTWGPRGNSAKKLRFGVNSGRRAGLSVCEVQELSTGFIAEVEEIMSTWLGTRRAGVSFGWLFQLAPLCNAGSKKYFTARDADGRLAGMLAASPIPSRDGWYLEDILRRPDSPVGTSDLLVFEALRALADQGYALATLGTVPLSQKGCAGISAGENRLIEGTLAFARRNLSWLYNFDGLGCFKSKFVPTWWENEYAVVPRALILPPRVANAVLNVVIPGGTRKMLQILFSSASN